MPSATPAASPNRHTLSPLPHTPELTDCTCHAGIACAYCHDLPCGPDCSECDVVECACCYAPATTLSTDSREGGDVDVYALCGSEECRAFALREAREWMGCEPEVRS